MRIDVPCQRTRQAQWIHQGSIRATRDIWRSRVLAVQVARFDPGTIQNAPSFEMEHIVHPAGQAAWCINRTALNDGFTMPAFAAPH